MNIFGLVVGRKALIGALLALGVIGGWFFGNYVRSLIERAVASETQLEVAGEVNNQNGNVAQAVQDVKKNNDSIELQEIETARARAQAYREIYHAIQTSSPSSHTISPVIVDTLDRLWAEEASSAIDP